MPFFDAQAAALHQGGGSGRPRAQGQEMTSTAMVAKRAKVTPLSRDPPRAGCPATVRTAAAISVGEQQPGGKGQGGIINTAGTKMPETRSANSWMGTLVPWASSTILMTWLRKVSLPPWLPGP